MDYTDKGVETYFSTVSKFQILSKIYLGYWVGKKITYMNLVDIKTE